MQSTTNLVPLLLCHSLGGVTIASPTQYAGLIHFGKNLISRPHSHIGVNWKQNLGDISSLVFPIKRMRVWGACWVPPAGPSRARPPKAFSWILDLNYAFLVDKMAHLLVLTQCDIVWFLLKFGGDSIWLMTYLASRRSSAKIDRRCQNLETTNGTRFQNLDWGTPIV